jgi:hypothetical protein
LRRIVREEIPDQFRASSPAFSLLMYPVVPLRGHRGRLKRACCWFKPSIRRVLKTP